MSVDQDVNFTEARGHTALHGAVRRGAMKIVEGRSTVTMATRGRH